MSRSAMGGVGGAGRATVFLAGLLCAVAALLLVVADPARAAASFTVSNTDDSGPGSLRQAITAANNNGPGEDTIIFAPSIGSAALADTIALESALPDLSSVNIEGPGAERLTVTPARDPSCGPGCRFRVRIFTVGAGATVSIEDLTMSEGGVPTGEGGAVFNPATGTLKISGSSVSHSEAGTSGGGIYNEGTLEIVGSSVSGNRANQNGGGIFNAGGNLTITDSDVCDNRANQNGGGVFNEGALEVVDSAVCGNEASGAAKPDGGGVYNASTLTVENSTLSANAVGSSEGEARGGAIFGASGSTLTMTNATISGNRVNASGSGAGLHNEGEAQVAGATITDNHSTTGGGISNAGTLALGNSIVARNNSREDLEGAFENLKANLIGGDPKLGALQDNGGPTKTHLPLADSPAIDQGQSKDKASTDQRGVERPQDDPLVDNPPQLDGTDIGAVELRVPQASIDDVTVTEGTGVATSASFTVRVSESEVSSRTLEVGYETRNDEATAPADYAAASGTLDFNSRGWALSKTVTVAIQGDAIDEPTEGFFVDLTSRAPEYVADASGLGIIRDDDEPPANGAPMAVGDSYSTAQDRPLRVPAPGLLANDSDPDGDALMAVEVTDPAHGEVFVRADGSFAYFPDEGYLGADSFTYKAKDGSASSEPATVEIAVRDATAPTVSATSPGNGATGVLPGANVTATFSEAMRAASVTSAFKLYPKGSTEPVDATLTYDAATKRAVLNPNANLRRGATYKAVVTTGARDLAGNLLDQDPGVAGNQQKVWSFTIRP